MVAHGGKGDGGNGHRPPHARPHHPNFHHHVHLRRIHGHYYVRPVGYVARVAEPGPCTCLWKGYTPEDTAANPQAAPAEPQKN
jgi:hypothetical protein